MNWIKEKGSTINQIITGRQEKKVKAVEIADLYDGNLKTLYLIQEKVKELTKSEFAGFDRSNR